MRVRLNNLFSVFCPRPHFPHRRRTNWLAFQHTSAVSWGWTEATRNVKNLWLRETVCLSHCNLALCQSLRNLANLMLFRKAESAQAL